MNNTVHYEMGGRGGYYTGKSKPGGCYVWRTGMRFTLIRPVCTDKGVFLLGQKSLHKHTTFYCFFCFIVIQQPRQTKRLSLS